MDSYSRLAMSCISSYATLAVESETILTGPETLRVSDIFTPLEIVDCKVLHSHALFTVTAVFVK